MIQNETINIFEKISGKLSALDKDGNPLPDSVISNPVYSLSNQIGIIVPDSTNPLLFTFIPNQAGVSDLSVTAEITIS